MRKSRVMVVLATVLAVVGLNAYAFHSGGVAECEGCHSMHSPASSSFLLVGSDPSSACLSCHEHAGDTGPSSYHVSTAASDMTGALNPKQRTPGGDFGWLRKDWTATGGEDTKDQHGHNIIAADNQYTFDPNHTLSPGGNFPVSQLGCESCHDPHGKARRLSDGSFAATGAPIIGSGSYDNSASPAAGQAVGIYRLLWGPDSPDKPTNANYTSYAVAVSPSSYNRTEAVTQTRVAYGGGAGANSWGKWCGACHGEFDGPDKTEHHPMVALGSDIATIYGTYVSSGNLTGDPANSYLSLVPFAEATDNIDMLKPHAKNGTYMIGPSASDAVTCMSCHRAHASGFIHALRFYYSWEFMTYDGKYPGLDNPSMTGSRKAVQAQGRNMQDFKDAYYDREPNFVGTYNRVLCNKCHAQD